MIKMDNKIKFIKLPGKTVKTIEGETHFITVSTDWCGPCKKMKKHITKKLPDFVSELNKKVVFIVVDGDDENNEQFIRDNKVEAFPTWFINTRINDENVEIMTGEGWGKSMIDNVKEGFLKYDKV